MKPSCGDLHPVFSGYFYSRITAAEALFFPLFTRLRSSPPGRWWQPEQSRRAFRNPFAAVPRLFRSAGSSLAVAACLLLGASVAAGASRSPEEAAIAARSWMSGHPLIKTSARELGELQYFPENATYRLHIFQLEPSGYLVLHSDDRLPLLVAFSTDSTLSLEDVPENAFRAFLVGIAQGAADQLAKKNAVRDTLIPLDLAPQSLNYPSGDFVVGPLLSSSWNQNDPYNLNAPNDPASAPGSHYDGRVPIGCVPLAFAQLLNFHRWPLNGVGTSTYTDNSGSITGPHSVNHLDSYDWDNMLDVHAPSDSLAQQSAVGELVYELAVAVGANFESAGTSSSGNTMRSSLQQHFRFEPSTNHTSYAAIQERMDADILAGYPAIVTIPGHAVVADGLLRSGADFQYHINYGWGGTNNGWFAHNNIPNGGIDGGVALLRPLHIPIPQQSAIKINEGKNCELVWTLPKRRNAEIDHLRILREATLANPWTHNAATIDTPASSGWSVVAEGYSGSCWFADPKETALIDLTPKFLPNADTRFEFWMKYRLATKAFRVSVSANGGESFTELQSWANNSVPAWQRVTLPLGSYAGQAIILRLELLSGTYYTSGSGVWLDDLAVTSGSHMKWEPLVENPATQLLEFSKTSTLWEDCDAFDLFKVTSTSTNKDWVLSNVAGVGAAFYKQPGGYSNRQYHLTSQSRLAVPSAGARLALRMKNKLATDLFRVLASTDGTTFTSIAEISGRSDWRNLIIDLSAYSGASIFLRLEYVVFGSIYSDGGVWIDSISVEQVTNPQYEQQPLHKTTFSSLPVGTHILAAQVVRRDGATTPIGLPLTVQVNPSAQYRVEFVPGTHGLAAGGGPLVQMVSHGSSAVLPVIDEAPGWLLTGWSGTHQNIQSDVILHAVYQELLAAHGTPHWWLIENGLAAPDATNQQLDTAELSDPSGKGNTAAFDYIAGTDPNVASDRLRFTRMDVGQSGIELAWPGSLGRRYRILRSSTLNLGSWTPVATIQCTVNDETLTTTVPMTSASGFFRIAVSLEQP